MLDRIISYEGNKYGARRVHNLLLPFLQNFDDHCRKYNISYSLAFGSALGCVRNNGFIPWDDDVDIIMKRTDYESFLDSLKNNDTELSKHSSLFFLAHLCKLCDSTSSEFPVFIDLYPADNVPDSPFLRQIKLIAVQLLKNVIIGRTGKRFSFLRVMRKVFAYLVSLPFSLNQLRCWFQKLSQWTDLDTTKLISCYSTGKNDVGKNFPSQIFDSVVYSKFEDIQLPIMADYQTYLTIEFGKDYMIPPEEDKRVPGHMKVMDLMLEN